MKYKEFEDVISAERMQRYVLACNGDERRGMVLYRYNLAISGEMLKIISLFEVALRNRIDQIMITSFGTDWLRDSCLPGGIFDSPSTYETWKIISLAYKRINENGGYTPTKLMTAMELGVWKYMYSGPEYVATGQRLLSVFPNKPKTTKFDRVDNKRIFNELNGLNNIRNRIAHHEPICFQPKKPIISIDYAKQEYLRIRKLLSWMGIDDIGLMYGVDHIEEACDKIMRLSSFCFSPHYP